MNRNPVPASSIPGSSSGVNGRSRPSAAALNVGMALGNVRIGAITSVFGFLVYAVAGTPWVLLVTR